MPEFMPNGMRVNVTLDATDDPLAVFSFTDEHGEVVQIMLGEMALGSLVMAAQEMMVRAAVLREMITMFPDLRDAILANLAFRWGEGEVGNGQGP